MQTPAQRGEPLKVSELVPGEYYEDILTEQRVLVVRVESEMVGGSKDSDLNVEQIEVLARHFNKVSGTYEDFWVANNQLRKWK